MPAVELQHLVNKEMSLTFGSEKERYKKRYQNQIYLCFQTTKSSGLLEISCVFTKSIKRKIVEMKEQIEKFQQEQNQFYSKYMSYSPNSRPAYLRTIFAELKEFYSSELQTNNRQEEMFKKLGKLGNKREMKRMAAAIGDFVLI